MRRASTDNVGDDTVRADHEASIDGVRGDERRSRPNPFAHGTIGDERCTPETMAAYQRKVEELHEWMIVDQSMTILEGNHFGRKAPLTDVVGTLIEWFQSQHGRWARATVRGYRSALVGWIETVLPESPDYDEADVADMLARALDLEAGPDPRPSSEPPRTSARKRKSVRPAEHSRIVLELTPRPGPGGPKADRMTELARLMVKQLVHLALRPVEVHGVEPTWETDRTCKTGAGDTGRAPRDEEGGEGEQGEADGFLLRVVNAKTTNGRGNGRIRTLDLSGCTPEDRREIVRLRALAAELLDRHGCPDLLHKALSERLARACDRAMLPRVCFYTLRHQALATAKAHMTKEEVSAFAGHGVTRTAVESHGRKRSAWPFTPKVRPTAADIARVDDNAREWMRESRPATSLEPTPLR